MIDRRAFLGGAAAALATAGTARAGERARIAYFRDGAIHVGLPGRPDARPLTSGHADFKPSWSRTGDMLVCFRRTRDDPVVGNWRSAIFVIGADGSAQHFLSDGSHTDFNPTWTRDGSNTPVWNRKNPSGGGYHVVKGRVGGRPGEEVALSDAGFHTWVHSCLQDGRMLANAAHPSLGWGVYLLHRARGGADVYERVDWELGRRGQMHRASIAPGERRICFEYLAGARFTEPGHTIYVADFDPNRRTIANLKAIANEAARKIWVAYPRWIDGESAVVYHSGESGRNQLYVHRLADGSTRRVSADASADYRYPHGEAAPC